LAKVLHGPRPLIAHPHSLPAVRTVPICRAADIDWRRGRVYFLRFSNPRGTTGLWPLPPGRPAVCHRRRSKPRDRIIYRSCRVGRAASRTGASRRVGWAVRSQQQRAPPTVVSRPLTPHRVGGPTSATLTRGVTLCDGKGRGRTLAEPPIGTLATAACFSLAVRVNACSRGTHAACRSLIVIGGSQELRAMDWPGVGLL
jgi:hypothetical protein